MPKTSKGRLFEEKVYSKFIISNDWINLTPYIFNKNTNEYTHKQFCSQFKSLFNFDPLKVWSKQINPDFVFYNPLTKKVKIFEAKCQTDKGSVDEKLQTSGYKIKQLRKLFNAALQIEPQNISYSYLLEKKDFNKPQYEDTFNDIRENGNEYYFVDENFSLTIE